MLVLREGSKHQSKNQTAQNPSWEENSPIISENTLLGLMVMAETTSIAPFLDKRS